MRRLVRKLLERTRRSLGMEQLRSELAQMREKLDYLLLCKGASQHQANGTHGATELPLLERVIHAPEGTASKASQLILANQYRALALQGGPLPGFQDVEFRAFSQNGEDGMLLYIFSLIGMGQRRCVEICAGDGIQCNTANLIINHGWHGLMFDGNDQLVERGRVFYSGLGDTFCFPPKLLNAWITRENINDLIREHGFAGPIDLLSLDIDGNDYWIWEAIDVVRPRVVIAETQCIWGSDRSVTVPYSKEFRTQFVDRFGIYCGASLPAFVKLGRKKGYRLVGVQNLGFNAVFLADEVGEELLPEVDAESCLDRPFVHWATRELLPKVQHYEWVEI
ncbi:MAG: hypothetical protein WBX00_09805 [Isosphaeraceae bacterium]|jgi:hypothetical protein